MAYQQASLQNNSLVEWVGEKVPKLHTQDGFKNSLSCSENNNIITVVNKFWLILAATQVGSCQDPAVEDHRDNIAPPLRREDSLLVFWLGREGC